MCNMHYSENVRNQEWMVCVVCEPTLHSCVSSHAGCILKLTGKASRQHADHGKGRCHCTAGQA